MPKLFQRIRMLLLGTSLLASCAGTAQLAVPPQQSKPILITLGNVSVEGEISPAALEMVHGELALTIRDTPKVKSVKYEYRLDVPGAGNHEMVFGVGTRRMYALVPKGRMTWSDLLRLDHPIATELELRRLEGAAEEES